MSNPAEITLEQLFRYFKSLPHQLAAISELEADLKQNGYVATMRRDRPWFQTWSQAGKQPDPPAADPAWLKPALTIIKTWEGCRLVAYRCPAGVPTIGYGTTRYLNGPVRMGDTITQAEAEALLANSVRNLFAPGLFHLIPSARNYTAGQQAALISFAYNLGLGAVEDSTLRRRLNAGESPAVVIPQEFPKWVHAGEALLEGLVRRRNAEINLAKS